MKIEVTEFATPSKKTLITISDILEIAEQPPTFGGGSVITTAEKTYIVTDRLYSLITEIKRLLNSPRW